MGGVTTERAPGKKLTMKGQGEIGEKFPTFSFETMPPNSGTLSLRDYDVFHPVLLF